MAKLEPRPTPEAWAQALMAEEGFADAWPPTHHRTAVAWALKNHCYAAWSSEPKRALRAADALQALSIQGRSSRQPARGAVDLAEREVDALAHWTAGIACVTRGRLQEAVHAFDEAHKLFRGLGQAGHAAATQVPRIMALSLLGEYEQAIACAEKAHKAFVQLGDRLAAAKVKLNLGSMYVHRGDYAAAVLHSREAAVLFARVGDHQHSIGADINMANALTSLGDFDEGLRVFARAEMRASAHAFPVLQASVEEAMAFLRLARGEYGAALKGFEGARRRYEQLNMTQEAAVAERQLAVTYFELRLLPEALALLDAALVRFGDLQRPDEQAWALTERGRVLAALGNGDAAESLMKATRLFASQGNASGESTVLLARAELALSQGHLGDAMALASGAARGFDDSGLVDLQAQAHMVRAHALLRAGSAEQARALFDATLAHAQALGLQTAQVRCLTGRGLAALMIGDEGTAKTDFLGAVALFEEQQRALPDASLRSAFRHDHLRPYQELLRLAMTACGPHEAGEKADQALRRLDCYRARSLNERDPKVHAGTDSATAKSLRAQINWLHRRVERLQAQGDSVVSTMAELLRTERALLEHARRERLAASPTHWHDLERFEPEALVEQLGAHDALVEYGVLDDELFACIVTRDGVQLHRHVASWSEVESALRSTRFQIETLRHGALPVLEHLAGLTARARKRLRQLHALVWQPLAPALQGCTRLMIVPHAAMAALPFAALEDEHGCLAQRHQLALAPSARFAWRGLLRQPRAPARATVLGESTHLPHAAAEANAVASLFQTKAHLGRDATITNVLALSGQSDVIHLACHAQFRRDNPMFSALHLHDGPLTVDRIEAHAWPPAIVVLSGCETGLADSDPGDEMVGLVRAFLLGGASRVMASLWPVDDAVTADFMTHFYAAMRRGEAPAQALNEAQLLIRDRHPHPLYWAAFTLHGGW